MNESDLPAMDGAFRYARRIEDCTRAVLRVSPQAERERFISGTDAVALGLFLECYPQGSTALVLEASGGLSTLYLAGLPGVRAVASVPRGPGAGGREAVGQVLASFPEEREKVSVYPESEAGSTGTGREVPAVEPAAEGPLVAFLGGLRSGEEVERALRAVFGENPRALVVVEGCWDIFVQSGIARYLGGGPGVRCRKFDELGPGLATSGLCAVFPEERAAVAEEALDALASLYSGRLDPLRLLWREEELVRCVNRAREELEQAQTALSQARDRAESLESENGDLKRDNARLERARAELGTRLSGRRYRFADALAEKVLRRPAPPEG